MKASSRDILFLTIAVCFVSGCQVGQVVEIGPQSYFNYPNSNVKAIGPVKVSMAGPGGFMQGFTSGETDAQLYSKALAQVQGANLIIDYVKTTRVYYPFVFPIYWSKVELEGTAARMEIGQQILK
jgi:hypothetical protein